MEQFKTHDYLEPSTNTNDNANLENHETSSIDDINDITNTNNSLGISPEQMATLQGELEQEFKIPKSIEITNSKIQLEELGDQNEFNKMEYQLAKMLGKQKEINDFINRA